ncbi:cell wall hydrolase [Pseudomonas juntendi]|jgi:spore germination cell wall hydrolase CwlJ-like protein|uniref:cell wall hydrolase n=1 Tax=Pseudomonas TaxID=286 RepID=UPI0006D3E3F9|nr:MULTISPECIES: cell wall hydrolase [Pseudomonas]MBA6120053.1 cell wall hydrolase [Pseudomonas juntendi]MBH3371435.1 cell wall hydrolase [Pseudomonas juntendi]MBI6912391.1 cell wall hydrolase [Pseudomonas juntendi]MBS6035959.1 cell wall hydrolase [Pseudomonas sp.]MCF3154997.1 cell wall hydrolase [Pseudomonas juntendi]
MRFSWMLIGLTTALLAAPLHAADPAKAAVAEGKAEALEEKVVEAAPPPKPAEKLTPSEAQAVDPAGKAPLDDSLTCLARTLYWEAKGADASDMAAVASVVLNRLGQDGFPDTICGVVKQGVENKACQFSWWCDGRPDQVEEPQRYDVAKEIARKALNQQLQDSTGGALYFHDRSVHPAWAKTYRRTAKTTHFLFYKPNQALAR